MVNLYEEYLTAVKRSETDATTNPSAEPEPVVEADVEMDEEELAGELADSEDDAEAEARQSPQETRQAAEEYQTATMPEPPEPPAPARPLMTAEVIADAKVLKAFAEQLRAVADEGKVCFEPDGIHVKVVDPAHVQMVELTLPYGALEAYDVFEDGRRTTSPCDLGLDFEKFLGVLAKQKGKVSLDFRFGGVAKETLKIVHSGSTREMGLIDTAGLIDPKVPVLVFPAKVALSGKTFLEILKSAGEVSDHIAITVTPTALRFVAEGDVDRYEHEFQAGTDAVEYLTPVTEEYKSLFPLDYLLNVAKTLKGSRLILSIGNDYPLRIDWDGPHTRGTYLTAPRIESPD